jgi:hypothetical protein
MNTTYGTSLDFADIGTLIGIVSFFRSLARRPGMLSMPPTDSRRTARYTCYRWAHRGDAMSDRRLYPNNLRLLAEWRIRKFSHKRIGPGSPAGAAPCRARPGPVALVPIAA